MNVRHTNYLGSALLAATTLVVAACSGGKGRYVPPAAPQNAAPTIAAIADRSADQDTNVSVEVAVADAETPVAQLTVTAKADAGTLFPADGVVLGGSGATRTLTLTPLEAQTGAATITISAIDAQGLTTTRAFKVTVNAKTASAWATLQSVYQKGEKDSAVALNGFTYTQDVGDQINALLPPAEPIAGIE